MGLLDGGVAALFGEVFGGVFLPAKLRTAGAEPTYDAQGTLRRSAAAPRDCRVQIDSRTERWRQEPGFTADDVRVIVLAASLEGGVESGNLLTPETGAHAGQTFRILAPIERDPAAAGYVARGARVNG